MQLLRENRELLLIPPPPRHSSHQISNLKSSFCQVKETNVPSMGTITTMRQC